MSALSMAHFETCFNVLILNELQFVKIAYTLTTSILLY